MKKLPLFLLILFLFNSCNQVAEKIEASENARFEKLASPITLNNSISEINLADYFPQVSDIDSFTFEHSFEQISYENGIIKIKSDAKNIPFLSTQNIWAKGEIYSILLKKSSKIFQKVVFDPNKKSYEKVQLKGEMNAWNASATYLEFENGIWHTGFFLSPGKYSYQFVVDDRPILDPNNPDSVDNNIGGFNSVLMVGEISKTKPILSTIKSYGSEILIESEFSVDEVFVFWQNFRLNENQYSVENNQIKINIPEQSKQSQRSYIRVWAFNGSGVSNDLLIPLSKNSIVSKTTELNRADWYSSIIYNIMVDRFNNGNIQNDQPTKNPDILPKANYFGGDIEGIKKKISDGYFSNLGINTIWISPIVQNALGAYGEFPEPFTRFSAYHGYWPTSFTKIDFHFGTSQDFHNLVETAHNSNLNILLDFVANHVHEKHPIYKKHPDWATSLYLPDGTLNTEKWDEHRLTTWFDTFLPTLDLSKPEVYEMLSDSAVFWIKEYNIDGFRHDATKHIPEVFWRTLTKKLKLQIRNTNSNIYQIGETYGTRELIGTYINSGELDAQFDFNIYDDAVAVFAKDDESFERLSNSLNESFKYYGNHHLMGNITGNQDRPRFITYASGAITFAEDSKKAGWTREINVEDKIGYKKMALLSAFVMTIPGIPIIFYGDEFGMVGANDPDNRRMMRFDNLNDDENILRDITSKLISLRKNNLPLIYGDTKILKVTKKTFVFARTYFDQIAIVVFNKSNNSNTIDFEIPDRFSGKKFKASFNSKWKISENNMEIEIAGNSFEVILF